MKVCSFFWCGISAFLFRGSFGTVAVFAPHKSNPQERLAEEKEEREGEKERRRERERE